MKRKTVRRAVIAALCLTAAACGGGAAGDRPTTAAPAAFPVEVAGTVIPAEPQRILSASASHTEILFALGAGESLVATDQFSNYPPEAALTAKVDAFNLGVESVAAFSADLVVLSYDPGDLRAGLAALGIPTLLFPPPANLEEAFGQVRALGAATGREAAAEDLVAGMQGEVARLVASVPPGDRPFTYYYELDPTLYSATSETFVGGLLALMGLESIADPADTAGTGYPQLSAEFILAADPDWILLADTRCCGQTAAALSARPGWGVLQAVRSGRVVLLDDDVASRWGPRLVDLLAAVAAALSAGGSG